VGCFRVARMGGKGTVSAAARMKLIRTVCVQPEIVVSSLTLIPLRAKLAEKEIVGKPANEFSIKRASVIAANEILALAEKDNAYERTLIEITVARTLRSIMEGSIPVLICDLRFWNFQFEIDLKSEIPKSQNGNRGTPFLRAYLSSRRRHVNRVQHLFRRQQTV